MIDRTTKIAVWAIVLLLFVFVTCVAVDNLRSARRAADDSAHAALTKEICTLLEEIPRGQPYPKSLSELDLTFPDGGDESLLKRFEYSSDGTTARLRTVFRYKEIVQSFPLKPDTGRNDGR